MGWIVISLIVGTIMFLYGLGLFTWESNGMLVLAGLVLLTISIYYIIKYGRSEKRSKTIKEQASTSIKDVSDSNSMENVNEEASTDSYSVLRKIVHLSSVIEKQYYKKLYDLQKPIECHFVAGLSAILAARVVSVSPNGTEDVAALLCSDLFEESLKAEFPNETKVIPTRSTNNKLINVPLDLFLASSRWQLGSLDTAMPSDVIPMIFQVSQNNNIQEVFIDDPAVAMDVIRYIASEMFSITYANQDIKTLSQRMNNSGVLREAFGTFFNNLFLCIAEGERLCIENKLLFPQSAKKSQDDIQKEDSVITIDSSICEVDEQPYEESNDEQPEIHSGFMSSDNNKQFCKYCGEKIDSDSVFCRFCGKQQTDSESAIKRPRSKNAEFRL